MKPKYRSLAKRIDAIAEIQSRANSINTIIFMDADDEHPAGTEELLDGRLRIYVETMPHLTDPLDEIIKTKINLSEGLKIIYGVDPCDLVGLGNDGDSH